MALKVDHKLEKVTHEKSNKGQKHISHRSSDMFKGRAQKAGSWVFLLGDGGTNGGGINGRHLKKPTKEEKGSKECCGGEDQKVTNWSRLRDREGKTDAVRMERQGGGGRRGKIH